MGGGRALRIRRFVVRGPGRRWTVRRGDCAAVGSQPVRVASVATCTSARVRWTAAANSPEGHAAAPDPQPSRLSGRDGPLLGRRQHPETLGISHGFARPHFINTALLAVDTEPPSRLSGEVGEGLPET